VKKKKKHFFVTGGSGFLGAAICNLLVSKGHKVTIFDNNSRGSFDKIKNIKGKIKFIRGDIRDYNKLNASLKYVDAVVHLAYVNGTKYFYSRPVQVLEIATKGIVNIIDACINNKIGELYLASSSEVYQTPKSIPTDETESLKIPDIYNPRYSYGGGKILTELIGINNAKFFKRMIIFRPHNVYGKDMGNEHVIPELIKKVKNAKKILKIKGSGLQTRSFIYIDDFVQAFYLIFKSGKHLNIYNIGTQEQIKIIDLARNIIKIFKKKLKIKKGQIAEGGTQRRTPNINKIRKLGFKKKFSIVKGLKKIVD